MQDMHEMSEQLYDIYTQWHVPFWQKKSFLFVCGCIAVTVVGIVIWRVWHCFFVQKKKELPYHVIARNKLAELQSSEHACCVHAHLFYARLIEIIKTYLSAHFESDFISKTDQECLTLLALVTQDKQICTIVEHVLNGSATVRFARESAVEAMIRDDLAKAFHVINRTQIREKQPSEASGA